MFSLCLLYSVHEYFTVMLPSFEFFFLTVEVDQCSDVTLLIILKLLEMYQKEMSQKRFGTGAAG